MKNICSKCKGILTILLLVLALTSVCPGSVMNVEAGASDADVSAMFDIDAQLVNSDEDTYNISLTVGNKGEDWEGIVRVMAYDNGSYGTAYDTVLTLPQGSEKQFVVKFAKGINEYADGSIRVTILDKKSKVLKSQNFTRFLLEEMESISLGILSDDYSALTFLDVGGNTLYYYGDQFPIKLVELKQGSLVDVLDVLTILVIDKYNTDILTDEELLAIVQWVNNGGVLIVGTGSYAPEVWSGLADVITDVEITGVLEPGDSLAGITGYGSSEIDMSKLPLAQLTTINTMYYETYFSGGLNVTVGDGAIGILPYSLVELGEAGDSIYVDYFTQEDYIFNLLEEITSSSRSRYDRTSYTSNRYDQVYNLRTLLGAIGNSNTTLNFGVLKLIVILYVIFVGPVLYLILRANKKREWYWVTVPATALVGIVIIFFAGRGFEVVSTKVYSVTTQDVDGEKEGKTFLYCYDAEYKEWDLQLADGYEYAGSLQENYYYYYNSIQAASASEYYYRVLNKGGRISVGINPDQAFEDSYFYAGKSKGSEQEMGSIECDQVKPELGGISGKITNNTDKDFLFFLVLTDDTYYVYENLPVGESCSLRSQPPIYYSSQLNNRNSYVYDFLRREYNKRDTEELTALAALGVGMLDASFDCKDGEVLVCGVTADWEKTVDDDCSEVSYGCLYTIQ